MSLHSNPSIKKSDKIQDKDIDYNVKMKLLEGGLTDFSENVRRQMKIDKAGQYMMSDAKDSEAIATEISKLPGLESKKIRITDACAGVGGNTLQFIFHTRFESVVAIEKDEERCNQFLNHNIKIAKTKSKKRTAKCDVRAVDYLSEIHKHEQDVVFFDPPWGAKSYCHHDEIALFLGEKHMAEIVADLYRNSKQNKTKYVVIKACNNFAVDDMQRILGELCVGFQSKSSENCVEMLYSAKKRGRRGGGQKYPVYYIKIPDVVEEDKQMTYYDPQYIPISHGHCRIYLHLNNALQNLRYGGLFYIEEAIEQKSGLLGFLEQEWQQRDSDHVSIVLNIVQAMDKDVKGCDFSTVLKLDTRANIEQFASLPLHTKKKLDTYTEDNKRNITPGDCYSQNISFLENKKQELSNFMDEWFTGNKMLLVYLIGKEHYPMILSVEKQEDQGEKRLRLHHITPDALERFQSRFQEKDCKRLIKDEQAKFATNRTSKQADLRTLQGQSHKIFKYEAQHAYFDAMASANESHIVDKTLSDFLKRQYDWIEGDNDIEKLLHEDLSHVSEPGRQILQKYQQEIGHCIQANQERNEMLESEFKEVGSIMNPGESISTERGVRNGQKELNYSKQTRTKRQPEGTNSAMSVGSRQAPKRRQGAEKQNIRKAWKQFKRREINSSNLIRSGFTSTNQPNLFEFNTKLFYLHAFGKLMSEFLSMSIEKKLEKISEFFFASRYIPAARGEFMDLCCELYWQPALLRNTAGQYPEIYGAEQNDAMQLIKLYEEFQKNWRLLLCYRMHTDPGFAQSAKLRGFCPQYMKSKKLQSSIMEQKKLYTYPVLPTPKTDMKLIVTSTANDATVRASDFLWSNPNEQKKLVEKYAGRRMTFELDERVPSNDMIDKYYIDKFSKTFLKLHTNTIEQFNVEMLKICKSIYQMMYDVLALSDPQWGDKNPRATLFKIKDQVNSSLVKPSGPNAADVQGKAMKSDEIPPSPPKDLDITKFFNKAETSYDEQVQDKIEKILMQKKLTFMPYVENIVMECLKITKPDAKIKKTREDLLRDDAKSLKKIVQNISIWMAQTMEQSCEHDGTTRFWELANGEPEDSLLNRVIEVKPNQGLSIPRANAFTLHDTSLRNIFKKQENRSAGFFEREYKLLQANRKYRPFGLCWEKVPQSDKLGDDKIDALITEVQKLRNDISEEEKETPKNYMHRNFIELQLAFCVLKYPRIAVEEDDEYKYIVLEGSVPCKIKKTMIKRAQTIDGITRKITGVEYKPCIVPDGLKEIFEKRLQLFRNEWTTHGKEIIEQIENHRASLPDSEKWKARNIYLIDDTEGKECYYFPRNIVMDEYYSRAEPRFYREFITPFSPSTILKVQREDTVQYYFTPCYDSYFGRFSARTFFKWKNGIPVQEYREEELANLMVYLRQEVALAVKYRRNFYWFENRCLDLVWAVLRGVEVLDTGCEDIIQRVYAEGFSGDVENMWKSAHGTLLRRNFDRAGNHAAQNNKAVNGNGSLDMLDDWNKLMPDITIHNKKIRKLRKEIMEKYTTEMETLLRNRNFTAEKTYNTTILEEDYESEKMQSILKTPFEEIKEELDKICDLRLESATIFDDKIGNFISDTEEEIKNLNQSLEQKTQSFDIYFANKHPTHKEFLQSIQSYIDIKVIDSRKNSLQSLVSQFKKMDLQSFESINIYEEHNLTPALHKSLDDFEKLLEHRTDEERSSYRMKNLKKDFAEQVFSLPLKTAFEKLKQQHEKIANLALESTEKTHNALEAFSSKQKQKIHNFSKSMETEKRKINEFIENHDKQIPDFLRALTSKVLYEYYKLQWNILESIRAKIKDRLRIAELQTKESKSLEQNDAEDEQNAMPIQNQLQQSNDRENESQSNEGSLHPTQNVTVKGQAAEESVHSVQTKHKEESQHDTSGQKNNDLAKKNLKEKYFPENFIKTRLQYSKLSDLWNYITDLKKRDPKITKENIVEKLKEDPNAQIFFKGKYKEDTEPEPNASNGTSTQHTPPITSAWGQNLEKVKKLTIEQKRNMAESDPYSEYQFLDNNLDKSTRFTPTKTVEKKYKYWYEDYQNGRELTKPWMSAYQVFLQYMDSKGNTNLSIVDVKPNGNCMFYMLSFLANLMQIKHEWTGQQMRETIMKDIQTALNRERKDQITVGNNTYSKRDFQGRLQQLQSPNEWGSELEIEWFFKDHKNIVIQLYTPNEDKDQDPFFKLEFGDNNGTNPIFSILHADYHYVAALTEAQIQDMQNKAMDIDKYLHKKHIKKYLKNIWYYDDVSEDFVLDS